MSSRPRFAIILLAALGLVIALSASASASPGFNLACGQVGCHSGTELTPVATQTGNNGVDATYTLSGAGTGWAVFSGSTKLTFGTGATGQFTVPVGSTYTVYAAGGIPGPFGTTTVSPVAPSMFTITPSAGAGGTISPATAQSVAQGGTQTFTITANTGFHVTDVLVDGVSVGAVSTFTFTDVVAAHTIAAAFAANAPATLTITPSAGAGGTINPSTPQDVNEGGTLTFTIAANAGFHIADVRVDGISMGALSTFTFTNIVADHTIAATFASDAQIAIAKTASPTRLTAGPGWVEYRYTVTNPGTVALSNVRVTDDRVAAILFVSGDTNGDSLLQPGETWIYWSRAQLAATTTNTGTAMADAAGGVTVSDSVALTVAVSTAVGGVIPDTATPWYTLLLAGLALTGLGVGSYVRVRNRTNA